jgi:D-alanyl-D-alanine carboxypeptidase (penicillin-binding protein 5/6)
MESMSEMSISTYNAKRRTKKKRRSPVRAVSLWLSVIIGVFCVYMVTNNNKQIPPLNNGAVGHQSTTSSSVYTVVPDLNESVLTTDETTTKNWLMSNVNIHSTNAILINYKNGAVLFDKNGTEKMYPASMTKIMTAIVALEYISDLNDKILLKEAIFQSIYNSNAAIAGFLPGENVRAIDLLYGLLLPSGAECAIGLAEYVAGSENSFVKLMNDKAREIGMHDSNFTNTTGLHDNNHYSTAMDIAVLFQYALENDTFYRIIASSRYSTPSTNKHSGGITFYSTLFSNINNAIFEGGFILGGKTGYTDEAGRCLASLAEKDDEWFILVTCGAPDNRISRGAPGGDGNTHGAQGNHKTQNLHIDDAFTVYSAIEKGGI